MDQTTIDALIATASGNGIWAVLSMSLLVYVLKDSKKREEKADTREAKLMEHIEKTNHAHEKIVQGMDNLERRMEKLEEKMER